MINMRDQIPQATLEQFLAAWERNLRNPPRNEGITGGRYARCRSSVAALIRRTQRGLVP